MPSQFGPVATFIEGLASTWPDPDKDFTSVFLAVDEALYLRHGKTRSVDQALKKVHGDWYEYLLCAAALAAHRTSGSEWLAINLPSKSVFRSERLYSPRYSSLIADLRKKVIESADVILESSNPDFVVVRACKASSEICESSGTITADHIQALKNVYRSFEGQLDLDDLAGYLGAKFTLKPDRRLQLAHEGSLVKAIYVHIQTREWILKPAGVRYYGAASQASRADLQDLKTVATHSILTVSSEPQRAVDRVWVINSLREAEQMFTDIYQLCSMTPSERSAALRTAAVVDHGVPMEIETAADAALSE